MDWECLLNQFFLQVSINLLCLLIGGIVFLFLFYKLFKPTPPIATTSIPDKIENEDELGLIKVDILAISSAIAAAKKLKKDQYKRIVDNKGLEEAKLLHIEQNNRPLEDKTTARRDEEI